MKISETMENAMNIQMKNEFDSAFLYLSMSSWFQINNLPGHAHWCFLQYKEEEEHAMKFYKYIVDRRGKPIIGEISKPKTAWATAVDVFENILDQEVKVTAMINDLYKKAQDENDFASMSFLNWFLDEQIEEEEQSDDILQKLKVIGDSKAGLILLDLELAKRKED